METMPFIRESALFRRLEEVTSYAALTAEQRNAYDADLQVYRDLTNQLAYAEEQGEAKGFAKGEAKGFTKGKAEGLSEGLAKGEAKAHKATILRLHAKGVGMDMMILATGLTQKEIEAIIAANA